MLRAPRTPKLHPFNNSSTLPRTSLSHTSTYQTRKWTTPSSTSESRVISTSSARLLQTSSLPSAIKRVQEMLQGLMSTQMECTTMVVLASQTSSTVRPARRPSNQTWRFEPQPSSLTCRCPQTSTFVTKECQW